MKGPGMTVLCTGGESCGTKLMASLVTQMGANAIHRSYPWRGRWPDFMEIEFDAAIVMVRDWWAAAPSQVHHGHQPSEDVAFTNLRRAYAEMGRQLEALRKPWRYVVFQSLVDRPAVVLRNVGDWLDLNPDLVTEEIRDENAKWLQ